MKKWYLAPLAAVLLLAGCNDTEDKKTESDKKDAQKTEQTEKEDSANKTQEKAPVFYKIGDVVKLDGIELTIKSAEYTEEDEYSKAEKDKVITLAVSVTNTTDKTIHADSSDFYIFDKKGNQLEEYYGYDQFAINKDLEKGQTASSKLYFDVTAEKTFELKYEPAFLEQSKEVKWKIEMD
ncbi:DUF4352 domain-containing protein [Viridibacillus sp. YIM B01967]|uniref:DUF4352 domain-containing protein n=1 Tax=Viridibacillus soli TaxID=2798301 RepID=A0ABS1H5G9_9BACL|nr:DUF4352 domain-containing protein [Viridibacillus soli]MBK3494298.1 DUF4352 domain-containing protein [Viridibacillus soli]